MQIIKTFGKNKVIEGYYSGCIQDDMNKMTCATVTTQLYEFSHIGNGDNNNSMCPIEAPHVMTKQVVINGKIVNNYKCYSTMKND